MIAVKNFGVSGSESERFRVDRNEGKRASRKNGRSRRRVHRQVGRTRDQRAIESQVSSECLEKTV